ncbi:TonB-dependent receptor plug domain-containing protein [Candidatus Auribacterota bacterium]
MKKRLNCFLVALCFLVVQVGFSAVSLAEEACSGHIDYKRFLNMSLKDLLSIKVVTASRKAQKISEAPAALSVVTAEDIKQLGATQLPEALRMIVGVHFGYTNSNFMLAGGIRGFHKLPANKVVLLIDGVLYSFELYAVPSLANSPISLEEIERIEVLRGPGSSLYGANAMFGVINVITKKTEATKGTLLSLMGGQHKTLIGTLMQGGAVKDNFNYRVTLSWDQRDNKDYIAWSSDPVQKYWLVNTTMDYSVSDNSQFSLFASYNENKKDDMLVESAGPQDYSETGIYRAVLTYTSKEPNIAIKAFIKDNTGDCAGYTLGTKFIDGKMGSSGIEFQHIWEAFENDTLVWGANFMRQYAETQAIGGKHTHNLPGIFMDNTYAITETVNLNAGLRYDKHPNAGRSISHRLTLQYLPNEKHNFRFTWGSSFRNPDFIESYYNRVSPYLEGMFLNVYGQKDLDPEKAATFELAYNGQLTKKCFLGANLFYSKVKDFICFGALGSPYVDASIGGVVIPYPFFNMGDGKQMGAELEIKYQFNDNVTGIVNYTYIDQKEKDAAIKQLLAMTPQNQANAQLRAKFDNGVSANLTIHYKSETQWRQYIWPSPQGNTAVGGKADSYIFANLRVGYTFKIFEKDDAEIAIAVLNITDKKFDEYPMDTSDVARRITGSFRLKV